MSKVIHKYPQELCSTCAGEKGNLTVCLVCRKPIDSLLVFSMGWEEPPYHDWLSYHKECGEEAAIKAKEELDNRYLQKIAQEVIQVKKNMNSKLRRLNSKFIFLIGLLIVIISTLLTYYYLRYRTLNYIPANGLVKLSIEWDPSLNYNNSVGNEWIQSVVVDGESVSRKGDTQLFYYGGDLDILAKATELDEIDDVGFKRLKLPIEDLNLQKDNNYTINVVVIENKGRYSGNKAEWEFNVKIKRRVSLNDILNYLIGY